MKAKHSSNITAMAFRPSTVNLGNFLDDTWLDEGSCSWIASPSHLCTKMAHSHPISHSTSIKSDTFHIKTRLDSGPPPPLSEHNVKFSELPHSFLSALCAYPSGRLHHDLDANVCLLVLVDQTHQLLSILRLHQHDRTGKGVCFSQLCVPCWGWWPKQEGKDKEIRMWYFCIHPRRFRY